MSNYNELVTILKELLFNRFYPKPQYIRGLLGDGRGNVLVPERPDYNYVRFSRASSETFEVFNKEVSQPVDGWPVLIGEFPWTPGLVQVVATDWSAYAQTGWGDSVASIQAHAPTHEWPNFAPGSDTINTYLRAITPMRTQASASGSTSVMVTAYEYDGPTGTNYGWPGVPELALGAATPATGTMRYMGVYLNPATNTLGVVTGSTTIFTDALEPPRPAWPRGVMPTAYVRLYGGQSQINERDIRDARRLWENTLVFTGSMAAASQATVNAGLDTSQAVTPATLTNREPDRAKNTSGATALQYDVGYLNEAGEYKTTTTAGDTKNWCVVVTGGANNADITVATRGRRTVRYTGTAPSAGHFLTTSTVAGSALRSTVMDPAIFAVCLAGGSGGLVEVLLLCGNKFVQYFSNFYVVRTDAASTSDFVALINSGGSGGLTTTNVPYDTISSGAENVIKPANQGGSELGRMRLYNSTRGTYRLITAVDTALDKITTVASTDSWADNDSITIRSQTCVHTAPPPYYIDVDLSQQTEIPILARSILVQGAKLDSSATPGQIVQLHPFETFNAQKQKIGGTSGPSNTFAGLSTLTIPLIQQRFCWRWGASGAGTSIQLIDILGYWVAAP